MLELSKLEVDYKIAPPESVSIIGSNSVHTSGELYVLNVNAISRAKNKRLKRIFDFTVASLLLICSPVIFLFYQRKKTLFANIFKVLSGKKVMDWLCPRQTFAR